MVSPALAPVTATATISGDTLPTQLNNVSVTVNGEPAFVDFIGNTQVNFLVPGDVQPGPAKIVVTSNGLGSAPVALTVAADSPGFFPVGAENGNTYIAAQHPDFSLVGPTGLITGVTTTGAKAGETIALYGTGFGATIPAAPNSAISTALPLAHNPTVLIGGVPATVVFAGLIAPGLYQINVTVPSGLPAGDAAVVAALGNGETQAGAFITIAQ